MIRGALLLFFLVAGAGAAPAQEGVLLAPRFTPGERIRYRMTLTIHTQWTLEPVRPSAADTQPVRVVFDIGWQLEVLEAAADGSVSLRATIEELQVESSPPSPETPATSAFVGKAVSYRTTPEGRVEDIQAPPEWLEEGEPPKWLRSWLEQGTQSTANVPRRPLQPGESWREERDLEAVGLPRQRLRSESTYQGNEEVDGVPCAGISTRFEVGGADTREERTGDGETVTTDSRADGSGSRLSCYDLTNGRLLESTQTTEETLRIGVRRGTAKSGGAPVMLLETRTKIEARLRVVP